MLIISINVKQETRMPLIIMGEFIKKGGKNQNSHMIIERGNEK